ncbi:MAG: hypothetical protein IJV54_12315 [Bacteroidales bacterium]|nr:hypothetical protein [Bacteroidales bacterium]
MSGYNHTGTFQEMRTFKRWLLVIDGEEVAFLRKRDAFSTARLIMYLAPGLRLIEETTCRFRTGGRRQPDQKFRIDLTDRIPSRY